MQWATDGVCATAPAGYGGDYQSGAEKRPARLTPAGPWPVQLRYPTEHTGEQYVSAEAWSAARLPRCPNHPHGGCSFARHGTYRRKTPAGTLIARWYCPESHTTFSLLPDCLAARLPGTLDELEAVVAAVEQAPSLISAADQLRPDAIALPGALRWLRRRVRLVRNALAHVIGLLSDQFARCGASVAAFRQRLGTTTALRKLRELTASWLATLPAPPAVSAPMESAWGITKSLANNARGLAPRRRLGSFPPAASRQTRNHEEDAHARS